MNCASYNQLLLKWIPHLQSTAAEMNASPRINFNSNKFHSYNQLQQKLISILQPTAAEMNSSSYKQPPLKWIPLV